MWYGNLVIHGQPEKRKEQSTMITDNDMNHKIMTHTTHDHTITTLRLNTTVATKGQ